MTKKPTMKQRCVWAHGSTDIRTGKQTLPAWCKHQNECGPKCKYFNEVPLEIEGPRR